MLGCLSRIWPFGRKPEYTGEQIEEHTEAKREALERVLGPMDDMVGHAIIPFAMGGAVDMYYFTKSHVPGTVFATMELIEPDGSGPRPSRLGTYELVACTRLDRPPVPEPALEAKADGEGGDAELTPFDAVERRACGLLTTVGFYSSRAVVNPGETCEIPG